MTVQVERLLHRAGLGPIASQLAQLVAAVDDHAAVPEDPPGGGEGSDPAGGGPAGDDLNPPDVS